MLKWHALCFVFVSFRFHIIVYSSSYTPHNMYMYIYVQTFIVNILPIVSQSRSFRFFSLLFAVDGCVICEWTILHFGLRIIRVCVYACMRVCVCVCLWICVSVFSTSFISNGISFTLLITMSCQFYARIIKKKGVHAYGRWNTMDGCIFKWVQLDAEFKDRNSVTGTICAV